MKCNNGRTAGEFSEKIPVPARTDEFSKKIPVLYSKNEFSKIYSHNNNASSKNTLAQ